MNRSRRDIWDFFCLALVFLKKQGLVLFQREDVFLYFHGAALGFVFSRSLFFLCVWILLVRRLRVFVVILGRCGHHLLVSNRYGRFGILDRHLSLGFPCGLFSHDFLPCDRFSFRRLRASIDGLWKAGRSRPVFESRYARYFLPTEGGGVIHRIRLYVPSGIVYMYARNLSSFVISNSARCPIQKNKCSVCSIRLFPSLFLSCVCT